MNETKKDDLTKTGGIPCLSGDILSLFEPALSEDEAAKLFKDKSPGQIREINSIFIAAKNGASQEDLLDMESRAFYRLMEDRNGGGSNE